MKNFARYLRTWLILFFTLHHLPYSHHAFSDKQRIESNQKNRIIKVGGMIVGGILVSLVIFYKGYQLYTQSPHLGETKPPNSKKENQKLLIKERKGDQMREPQKAEIDPTKKLWNEGWFLEENEAINNKELPKNEKVESDTTLEELVSESKVKDLEKEKKESQYHTLQQPVNINKKKELSKQEKIEEKDTLEKEVSSNEIRKSVKRNKEVTNNGSSNIISESIRRKALSSINDKKKGYSSLKELPEEKNYPIMIVKTGSFRFPHKDHIQGNLDIYRILRKAGYTNVIILLSPSHQSWIDSKCNQHQGDPTKGKSHLIRPSHEKRVELLEVLLLSLKKEGIITAEEYSHIKVSKTLEKNNSSSWGSVMKDFRKKNRNAKIIYCSGVDLIGYDKRYLIEDHVAFKRDVNNGQSSTNIIIGKGKYRSNLKAELPDYYDFLKETFKVLHL